MSHLTRCPACATVFRIGSSQLEARQGFVRCGQCAKVFDARAALTEEQREPDEDETLHIELDLGPPSTPPAAPAPPVQQAASSRAVPVAAADAPAPRADEAPVAAEPGAAEPVEYSLAEAEPPSPAGYDFGPQARRRSRAAAALWGVGSLVLLTALAGQAAHHFRSELAFAVPAARPFLEAACKRIGCQVLPPRHSTLLSIESSELQVDTAVPGLLTLNATLRNRATYAQAHPSIELTLTDADDRPLIRRVLAPADYLGDRLAREPLFPAASEHPVRLHIDATAVKPTGYRLFLFHP